MRAVVDEWLVGWVASRDRGGGQDTLRSLIFAYALHGLVMRSRLNHVSKGPRNDVK
jgi:hypothetical protein